jgi:TonB family protein
MKTLQLALWSLAALALPLAGLAQSSAPSYVPLKIVQTVPALFPLDAPALGLTQGEARVAIEVDATGRVTDALALSYSHPLFAEASLAAVRRWRFDPARVHGQPRGATVELKFSYSAKGTVLDFTDLNDWVAAEFLRLDPGSSAFSACLPRDLDRIPTPTKIVSPDYPSQVEQLSHGGRVTVSFYIDPSGKVRMPSVTSEANEANEALATLAVRAVEQWHFEPPMARGRPALVLVQQDFNFKPGSP